MTQNNVCGIQNFNLFISLLDITRALTVQSYTENEEAHCAPCSRCQTQWLGDRELLEVNRRNMWFWPDPTEVLAYQVYIICDCPGGYKQWESCHVTQVLPVDKCHPLHWGVGYGCQALD